ncbi:MAG: hypothetical protein QNJ75_05375 [Acidimicrobiia bacterium]|nr:hypothetical protein [Acidimicrobiia bacterium]
MRSRLPRRVTIVLTLISLLLLSACNGEWSNDEFDEAVGFCEETFAAPGGEAQCEHTVTLLRDDLGCSVETVNEFFELASRLDYEESRALLDKECDNPSGGEPGLPGG